MKRAVPGQSASLVLSSALEKNRSESHIFSNLCGLQIPGGSNNGTAIMTAEYRSIWLESKMRQLVPVSLKE